MLQSAFDVASYLVCSLFVQDDVKRQIQDQSGRQSVLSDHFPRSQSPANDALFQFELESMPEELQVEEDEVDAEEKLGGYVSSSLLSSSSSSSLLTSTFFRCVFFRREDHLSRERSSGSSVKRRRDGVKQKQGQDGGGEESGSGGEEEGHGAVCTMCKASQPNSVACLWCGSLCEFESAYKRKKE